MATFDDALTYLKKENVRITPQRIAILEFLTEVQNHPTAEDVYRAIEAKFPGISVATVYNNLKLFTEIGFLKEMNYGSSSSRYDFSVDPHYHVICQNCGKVSDFFYPKLDDVEMAASQLTDYQVRSHRLEIYGLCPTCQQTSLETEGEIK